MALTVTSGVSTITNYTRPSFRISWGLGRRSTLNIDLEDLSNGSGYRPTNGKEMVVLDSGTPIFGGVVQEFEQTKPDFHASVLYYTAGVAGYESRLDRIFINAVAFGRAPFSTNAISDTLTFDNCPFSNGYAVAVRTTGTAPAGLSTSTKYYVINRTSTTCQLSTTSGGSAVNFTDDGSGLHHLVWYAGAIVRNLVTVYGLSEGLTIGTIRDGSPVELMTLEWSNIADAIQGAANLCAHVWRINADKSFDFIPRTENTAPFSISSSSSDVLTEGFKFRHTDETYANKVYVRIAEEAFAQTLATKAGDGSKRIFSVATVIKAVSTITVDAVEKTVGIYGVDSGKDWYYTPGDYWIYQDAGGTTLTGSETLYITYRAYGFDSRSAEDTGEQSARAALESGASGIYEIVVDASSLYDVDQADNIADATIAERKVTPIECNYRTRTAGVRPGQLQTINLSDFGVNTTFLIDQVDATLDEGANLQYDVHAISTTRLSGYLDVFRSFLSSGSGSASVAGGGGAGGSTGSLVSFVTVTLTADATISRTVGAAGDLLYIDFVQDATGGWVITYSGDFDEIDGVVDIGILPSQKTRVAFVSNGTDWVPQPGGMIQ